MADAIQHSVAGNDAAVTITDSSANAVRLTATGGRLDVSVNNTPVASFGGTTGLTASATGGAATLNQLSGTITSEAITTAAGADYVLTLTNSRISATSRVMATADNGTNTTEGLAINRVTPSAGSCIIRVRNTHASAALNGTIKINFFVAG